MDVALNSVISVIPESLIPITRNLSLENAECFRLSPSLPRQPRAVARPGSPRKCSSEAERRRAASGGSRPKLSAWPWTTRRGTEPATTTTRSTPIFTSSSAIAGRRPLTGRTRSRTWNSRVSGNFYCRSGGNSPPVRNSFIYLTPRGFSRCVSKLRDARGTFNARSDQSARSPLGFRQQYGIRSERKRSPKGQVYRFDPDPLLIGNPC